MTLARRLWRLLSGIRNDGKRPSEPVSEMEEIASAARVQPQAPRREKWKVEGNEREPRSKERKVRREAEWNARRKATEAAAAAGEASRRPAWEATRSRERASER